jgi:4-amino-4-deoxychorismate lyase
LWWRDQYSKLAADCAALNLTCPEETGLLDEVRQVAEAGEGVAKIMVTRGIGARGYAAPQGEAPTRVVLSAPLPPHARRGSPEAIMARWCSLRLARQPRLAGVKHLNRLENVLARAEWDDAEIAEGLLCDDEGMVVGGVMSNLWWARGGTLFTPDVSRCGVAGVARARLLRAAERLAIPVRIDRSPPAAILAADEVMICNSVLGVRRIARLGDASWTPAGWTDTLNTALHEELD